MARERGILSVQQYKEMAREHCVQMNQMIRAHNERQKTAQRNHLDHFVHETLGQMGAQELILEHQELARQMQEVQARFTRLMGKNANIFMFLPEVRPNLLDQIFRRDSQVSPALLEELEGVLARHGIKPSEATQVALVSEDALVARLRESQSTDEVKLTIIKSQMSVLRSLGIELPTRTTSHDGSLSGTV